MNTVTSGKLSTCCKVGCVPARGWPGRQGQEQPPLAQRHDAQLIVHCLAFDATQAQFVSTGQHLSLDLVGCDDRDAYAQAGAQAHQLGHGRADQVFRRIGAGRDVELAGFQVGQRLQFRQQRIGVAHQRAAAFHNRLAEDRGYGGRRGAIRASPRASRCCGSASAV